jgi:hypothetical protein
MKSFLLALCGLLFCTVAQAQWVSNDVGLTCDGSTDNTAALQQRIDTAGRGIGLNLVDLLAQGQPCMVGALTMRSYRTIDCQGIQLKLNPNTNATMFTTDNFAALKDSDMPYGEGNWTIRNCELDGNRAQNTAGDGIDVYGYQYTLYNNRVHDFAGTGLWTQWASTPGCPYINGTTTVIPDGCMEATIRDNKFFYNGGDGINFQGPHDSVIDGLFAFMNGAHGFEIQGTNVVMAHAHNYANGGYDFNFNGQVGGTDIVAEGGASGDVWIGGPVSIQGLSAFNCNGEGVTLGTAEATQSYIFGAGCSLNYAVQGGAGVMQFATFPNGVHGLRPPNVPEGAQGVWQSNILNSCPAGLKADANGTLYC